MKSAILQYPYVRVMESLEYICKRKGFNIISSCHESGKINSKQNGFLSLTSIRYELHIEKIEEKITRVNVTASSRGNFMGKKKLDTIEENLVNSIYKYF